MKYVGIKNCKYKSLLLKTIKKGKIISANSCDLAASCYSHMDILKLFDKYEICWENYKDCLYVKNNLDMKRSEKNILSKIVLFKKTYESIKNNGFQYNFGYIVVTNDGARLDGSHRAAIVNYIGIKSINVVELKWETVLKGEDLKKIKKHIEEQREKCFLEK